MFSCCATKCLIVTFAHGLLTSVAAYGVYKGGRNALIGYFSVVGLHTLMNLGSILLVLNLTPASAARMESYSIILAAFLLFQRYTRTAKKRSGKEIEEIVYFERGFACWMRQ